MASDADLDSDLLVQTTILLPELMRTKLRVRITIKMQILLVSFCSCPAWLRFMRASFDCLWQ